MRISIICHYPFPEGMAATNRIIAYSKGLIENGVGVDVYIVNPSDYRGDLKFPSIGKFEGINFIYPIGRIRFKNKFLHGAEYFIGVIATIFSIIKNHRMLKYDSLIISNDNFIVLYLFSRLAKFLRTKSIFIFDEYPIPIRVHLKSRIPVLKTVAYKIALKGIDGYISMTQNLLEYYSSLINRPGLIVSSITDLNRFEKINLPQNEEETICYMGNMQLSKDNVDNIIRAFALIAKNNLNVYLSLYGNPSNVDKAFLVELIKTLNIMDRVNFKYAHYSEVPIILKQSHILVSSQPKTKRAEGGFPTKLGEYLASGVPTLLTDVGEISEYVTHLQHVFLAIPDDPDDFANKLQYIINNYDEAKDIANTGRKLVYEHFSTKAAGLKIARFIASLK